MGSSSQQQRCRFVAAGPAALALGSGAASSSAERRPGAPLAFSFGAVGRRARCAALASVSLSGRAAPPAPAGGGAPLFSLAMAAPRRGVASSELSGGAAGSSEASDDTGSSSEDDTTATEAELQFLQSVNCASCSKPLLPRPRRRLGGLGGRAAAAAPEPSDYLVCDGCRRCFHERCCERGGVPTEAAADGTWYHDPDCKRAAAALRAQADRGPVQLPCGRAWQLVPLARGLAGARDRAAGGGGGAVAARKQQLQALVEVLAPEYGPGVADQLLESNGYALLLTSGGAPVTAATLDVYGTDLATMDLLSTIFEQRARGHGSALLHAAEQFLGAKARVRRLLAVASADEKEAAGVMARKFGFAKLNARQARLLAADFPVLKYYERSIFLSKDLSSAARAAQLKAAAAKAAAKAGNAPAQEEGKGEATAAGAAASGGGGAPGKK